MNFNHGLLWFGIGHLVAGNLGLWFNVVITEAYEGFHKLSHGEGKEVTEQHKYSTSMQHVVQPG